MSGPNIKKWLEDGVEALATENNDGTFQKDKPDKGELEVAKELLLEEEPVVAKEIERANEESQNTTETARTISPEEMSLEQKKEYIESLEADPNVGELRRTIDGLYDITLNPGHRDIISLYRFDGKGLPLVRCDTAPNAHIVEYKGVQYRITEDEIGKLSQEVNQFEQEANERLSYIKTLFSKYKKITYKIIKEEYEGSKVRHPKYDYQHLTPSVHRKSTDCITHIYMFIEDEQITYDEHQCLYKNFFSESNKSDIPDELAAKHSNSKYAEKSDNPIEYISLRR